LRKYGAQSQSDYSIYQVVPVVPIFTQIEFKKLIIFITVNLSNR